jgi:transcriptional regulator with XRE-family HTH domain
VNLGDRIKALREEKGYMQKEVADTLGIAANTLSGYERNVRKPDAPILNKIAAYYGVSVDFLLGNENKIDDLERDIPEGVNALRRIRNYSNESQKRILDILNSVIEAEERSIKKKK